jgi:hypothetical protein
MKNQREEERKRRQDRIIALYAVLQAWLRNLDGIVCTHSDISRLTGLQSIQHGRIDKMVKNMKVFFPYSKEFWTGPHSFLALFISRKPFADYLIKDELDLQKQVSKLSDEGLRLGFLQLWNKRLSEEVRRSLKDTLPLFTDLISNDEKLLAAYLALLAQGQISPKSIPPLITGKGT